MAVATDAVFFFQKCRFVLYTIVLLKKRIDSPFPARYIAASCQQSVYFIIRLTNLIRQFYVHIYVCRQSIPQHLRRQPGHTGYVQKRLDMSIAAFP